MKSSSDSKRALGAVSPPSALTGSDPELRWVQREGMQAPDLQRIGDENNPMHFAELFESLSRLLRGELG